MPLDPQIERLLAAKSQTPRSSLPVTELRAGMLALTPKQRTPVWKVENRSLRTPDGDIAIRIYRPEGKPMGCLAFFHGGGFVMGGLDTHDHVCRDLCVGSQAIVVAIDYRLAPEHPFPAALDDCTRLLKWMVASRADLNVKQGAIIVGGDSAGGNLATVLAMRARDQGLRLCGQVLLYPVTDAPLPFKPSYIEYGTGYSLTGNDMIRFWRDYIGGDEFAQDNPELRPLQAQNLLGLPDALVITAEFDPLRDEGEAYAKRLIDAGVPTTLTRYDGAIHGFIRMGNDIRLAAIALDQICPWMKARFASV